MQHQNKKISRRQMSESFLTAAFLSLSGGLQDAYTYLSRGSVFANAQTGNIVLFSHSLFEKNFSGALHYFIPLLFFGIGVAAAEGVHFIFEKSNRLHWRQPVLLLEIIILFIVGFIPDEHNLIANALVSFSCAMQVQAFRKVHGYSFASTMCIGNIRSGMEAFCLFVRTQDRLTLQKASAYFGVIVLFALGAGVGGVLLSYFGLKTIWISCLLLVIGFFLMFIRDKSMQPQF